MRGGLGPISQTDYGYTGQRDLGSDLGLMDYRARLYSPYLNRFVQPDSLIPSPTNPQAWNRFSYVNNNPLRFIDPTGHSAQCLVDDPEKCEYLENNGKKEKPTPPIEEQQQNTPPKSPLEELEEKLDKCSGPAMFTSQCQAPLAPMPAITPTPSQSQSDPSFDLGMAVQIESLIFDFINDINFSSPLFWRKTFTAVNALNPNPLADIAIGAVSQGLTDAFNPNLSTPQRF